MAGKKNRVLIFGGYSSDNRGDHAMLTGLLNWLETLDDSLNPLVYTTNPDLLRTFINAELALSPEYYCFKYAGRPQPRTAMGELLVRLRVLLRGFKFFLGYFCYRITGVSFIRKGYCLDFYERLSSAAALFLSGGGYMNSLWWLDGMYAKLFPVLLAKHMKVPVLLTSQGIGPFSHWLDRIVAGKIFKCADIIGLRERGESARELQKFGSAISSKVIITGDDSMLLEAGPKGATEAIRKREGMTAGEFLIAVNFRDSSSYASSFAGPDHTRCAELLDLLLSVEGRRAVFVPISYNLADDDRKSAALIVERMARHDRATILNREYTPAQLRELIGSTDLVIGTSYHFCLFALSAGVPAFGLYLDNYYQQKLEGLFSLFDMNDYCFNFLHPDVRGLHEAVEGLIRQKGGIVNELRQKNSTIIGIASEARAQMARFLTGSINHR